MRVFCNNCGNLSARFFNRLRYFLYNSLETEILFRKDVINVVFVLRFTAFPKYVFQNW